MCRPPLSTRVVSGKPRGKEWSTPAAPTVGHSHPLLPDSALLSSVLTAAVASMFLMLIFKTISRVRTRLIAGLLRPWTATWEHYWNLAVLWDRSHASNVVEGVRQCATRVDRGRPRWTAWVWMQLKSINARFLIQYRPPRSNAEEGYGQHSNAVYRWWRLNACERMRRRQWERCINLGLLTVTYGRAFWAVYRIVSRYFVQYRIVSIVFPHDHIVPSLQVSFRLLISCSIAETRSVKVSPKKHFFCPQPMGVNASHKWICVSLVEIRWVASEIRRRKKQKVEKNHSGKIQALRAG